MLFGRSDGELMQLASDNSIAMMCACALAEEMPALSLTLDVDIM